MIRSLTVWLAALWIALMIHLDWHLGRPGHDHLSFDFPYHWVVAVPTFAPLPWLMLRRWPASFVQSSVLAIVIGVLLGQGLEPLGEVVYFPIGNEPFANPVRWRVFGEFILAGVLTYIGSAVLARRRLRQRAA
jgi:hypothetical protein